MEDTMENAPKLNQFALISFIITLLLMVLIFPLLKLLNTLFNFNPLCVLVWPVLSIAMIVVNSLAAKSVRIKKEKGKGLAVGGIVLASLLTVGGVFFTLASFAING
jgi:hypothetical protein